MYACMKTSEYSPLPILAFIMRAYLNLGFPADSAVTFSISLFVRSLRLLLIVGTDALLRLLRISTELGQFLPAGVLDLELRALRHLNQFIIHRVTIYLMFSKRSKNKSRIETVLIPQYVLKLFDRSS